ncbi:MAG: hypothetical protein WAO83_04260 [Fuerstiella sp.]
MIQFINQSTCLPDRQIFRTVQLETFLNQVQEIQLLPPHHRQNRRQLTASQLPVACRSFGVCPDVMLPSVVLRGVIPGGSDRSFEINLPRGVVDGNVARAYRQMSLLRQLIIHGLLADGKRPGHFLVKADEVAVEQRGINFKFHVTTRPQRTVTRQAHLFGQANGKLDCHPGFSPS